MKKQTLLGAAEHIQSAIGELGKAKQLLLNVRSSNHTSLAMDIATLEELALEIEEEAGNSE